MTVAIRACIRHGSIRVTTMPCESAAGNCSQDTFVNAARKRYYPPVSTRCIDAPGSTGIVAEGQLLPYDSYSFIVALDTVSVDHSCSPRNWDNRVQESHIPVWPVQCVCRFGLPARPAGSAFPAVIVDAGIKCRGPFGNIFGMKYAGTVTFFSKYKFLHLMPSNFLR